MGGLRDIITLLKPGISGLAILTAALGLFMAPGSLSWTLAMAALMGTGMLVGSANVLNMVLERDVDALMSRTKDRPLPAGRMSLQFAGAFGVTLGILGTLILALYTNLLTTLLGVMALFIYVALYTPLKKKTPLALLIGAVPGAMPPLMGWTAATGQIEAAGLLLFAIMLVWQVPHFLAIAIFRKEDYANAGIKVVPVVRGNNNAQWQAIAYAGTLIPLTLLWVPLGPAGPLFACAGLGVSIAFFTICLKGRRSLPVALWARRVFVASLMYVPTLMFCMVLDRVIS
jgi:protoheme IX farnesyltransferase